MPNGTATFVTSTHPVISFSTKDKAEIEAIVFSSSAVPFTLTFGTTSNTPALKVTGAGITNDSPYRQHIHVAASAVGPSDPQLCFANLASAGGSNMGYYVGPEDLATGKGGGVIAFRDTASAGSAFFIVRTGGGTPHEPGSTVGGEVSFSHESHAATATFTIYGSLSTTDGDTFGNVVFHKKAKAHRATFTNKGATVAKGDGGNTQFYDHSNADNGLYGSGSGSETTTYGELR